MYIYICTYFYSNITHTVPHLRLRTSKSLAWLAPPEATMASFAAKLEGLPAFPGSEPVEVPWFNRLRWSWDHPGWHRNSWFSGSQVEHGNLIFFWGAWNFRVLVWWNSNLNKLILMNILTYIWSAFHRVFTGSVLNVEYIHSHWGCYMGCLILDGISRVFITSPLASLGPL